MDSKGTQVRQEELEYAIHSRRPNETPAWRRKRWNPRAETGAQCMEIGKLSTGHPADGPLVVWAVRHGTSDTLRWISESLALWIGPEHPFVELMRVARVAWRRVAGSWQLAGSSIRGTSQGTL